MNTSDKNKASRKTVRPTLDEDTKHWLVGLGAAMRLEVIGRDPLLDRFEEICRAEDQAELDREARANIVHFPSNPDAASE